MASAHIFTLLRSSLAIFFTKVLVYHNEMPTIINADINNIHFQRRFLLYMSNVEILIFDKINNLFVYNDNLIKNCLTSLHNDQCFVPKNDVLLIKTNARPFCRMHSPLFGIFVRYSRCFVPKYVCTALNGFALPVNGLALPLNGSALQLNFCI